MTRAEQRRLAAHERALAHAREYLTGTPEEIRWRKHRRAKQTLIRHGEGRWSALHPSLWEQAEREFQQVLEKRHSLGKATPPESIRHIVGGVITAIKIAGGREHYRSHVYVHNRVLASKTSRVLRKIALGEIPRPEGMR